MVEPEPSPPSLFQNGPDRRSVDIVMLSKPNPPSNLTRVNSTPSRLGLDDNPNESPAKKPTTKQTSPDSPQALGDPAAMLTVAPPKPGPADTLYPSPSGGFVPSPEEGQDWRLKAPPTRQDMFAASRSTSFTNKANSTPDPPEVDSTLKGFDNNASLAERSLSQPGPSSRPSLGAPSRPPSLPASQETASLIREASSASLSRRSSQASNSVKSPLLRPLSVASSVSRRISGPSTGDVSPQSSTLSPSNQARGTRRRRSGVSVHSKRSHRPHSTASSSTAQHGDEAGDWKAGHHAQVKIRDFAFIDTDPRHIGGREAGLSEGENDDEAGYSREIEDTDDSQEWGVAEDQDEDEFVGDEGDQFHLPKGIYKAMYQFVAESDHELAVEPDDLVRVVGALEGGWAIAIKQCDAKIKGLVPATYLEWVSES